MIIYTLSSVRFYNKVERKYKILVAKWDSLCKPTGWQKIKINIKINVKKGEWYYSKDCKHTKNNTLFASHNQ